MNYRSKSTSIRCFSLVCPCFPGCLQNAISYYGISIQWWNTSSSILLWHLVKCYWRQVIWSMSIGHILSYIRNWYFVASCKSITYSLSDYRQVNKGDRSGSVIVESSRLNSLCCGNGRLYLHLFNNFSHWKILTRTHNIHFKLWFKSVYQHSHWWRELLIMFFICGLLPGLLLI